MKTVNLCMGRKQKTCGSGKQEDATLSLFNPTGNRNNVLAILLK